jgi:OmpA-OmpF porin, OOP family
MASEYDAVRVLATGRIIVRIEPVRSPARPTETHQQKENPMPATLNAPRLWALIAAILVSALISGTARAQDVAGASDHPLVGRYDGSRIGWYSALGYEEVRLPDQLHPGTGFNLPLEGWTRPLAGRLTRIRYDGPAGRSVLEVLRNHEANLHRQGFRTVLFCRGREGCVQGGRLGTTDLGIAGSAGIPTVTPGNNLIYMLAERNDPEGHVHVAMMGQLFRPSGATSDMPQIAVTIVEGEPMQTDMIAAPRLVDSSEFEAAFAVDGRIAIYGITFDFNAADLRPDALPQIAELAQVLAANPALAVVIVGHTDSIGGFDYNLTLSQRRAQAVVDALAATHDIDRARMTPAGAGMVAPVATNRTEEGRARNRRVEIVEVVAR